MIVFVIVHFRFLIISTFEGTSDSQQLNFTSEDLIHVMKCICKHSDFFHLNEITSQKLFKDPTSDLDDFFS